VWSGWQQGRTLSKELDLVPSTQFGIRELEIEEPWKLRLFFLSLSWRAAASTRQEFARMKLPPDDLETLRLMLITNDPGDVSFYPTQLVQLSTRGEAHNQTPIETTKTIGGYAAIPERTIRMVRFYFDGLVVHIHRHATDDGYTESQGSLTVGHGRKLTVAAVPYDGSHQNEILDWTRSQSMKLWPRETLKLYR
jgi:hypothetical protein